MRNFDCEFSAFTIKYEAKLFRVFFLEFDYEKQTQYNINKINNDKRLSVTIQRFIAILSKDFIFPTRETDGHSKRV